MKVVTVLLTLLGTAVLSITTAQAAFVENKYVCEEVNLESSFDCSKNAVKVEKKRLNKVYMSAYRTLSSKQKVQLDKEQIAWLKTRNNKCDFEHDDPMNNSVVWAMIGADVCVANETQKRSKYLVNDLNIKELSTRSASPFQKIRTTGGGDITYYKGEAIVSGTLDVTHPDDEYTPCGLCFSVDKKDSDKIPRESGDTRNAWFSFDNSKYNTTSNTYELAGLKIRANKCYQPMKATIKIKDYMADKTPTETVDETTLVDIISMDKPKVIACESN